MRLRLLVEIFGRNENKRTSANDDDDDDVDGMVVSCFALLSQKYGFRREINKQSGPRSFRRNHRRKSCENNKLKESVSKRFHISRLFEIFCFVLGKISTYCLGVVQKIVCVK